MGHIVNQATGEVTLELEGHAFKLRASMWRLAELIDVLRKKASELELLQPGLALLQYKISNCDPYALYYGMRVLCTSGNEDKLKDMLLVPHIAELKGALLAALLAGLPEPDEKESGGNELAEAATATMN